MKKVSTRQIVVLGLLVALHIILSRFVSINAWNIKIGFAFVATFVGAYIYGPLGGVIVGGLGDFLGAILFPIGPYFPGFTLTCALTGLVFGLLLFKKQSKARIALAVAIDQLIISLWITTFWISFLYGSPFWPLMGTRVVQIAIMLIVQCVSIYGLIKVLDRIKAKNII